MYCNLRTWSSHRAQAVLNAENAQEAVEMLKVPSGEREFFIDNLLVRIHFITEMINRTGRVKWVFDFPAGHAFGSVWWSPGTWHHCCGGSSSLSISLSLSLFLFISLSPDPLSRQDPSPLVGISIADFRGEICSGSEEGSYLRLIDFVYHTTLGLRVIKKKKTSA